MRLLAMQGYINFFALITGSNTGSIAMHAQMGFEQIGLHPHTGYKFGRWHDVVWMCRRVHDGAPGEIIPAGALDAQAVAQEIEKTEAIIKEKLRASSKKP